MKRSITLSFLLLNLFFALSQTQSLNDISFQIAELNSGEKSLEFINNISAQMNETKNWSSSHFGLSIHLAVKGNKVVLTPSQKEVTLQTFLDSLAIFLEKENDKVFPLFLDYKTKNQADIEKVFAANEIVAKIYHQEDAQEWPKDINQLTSKGKQLLLFSFPKVRDSQMFCHVASNIAELPYTSFQKPQFSGSYISGSIENELMMVRHISQNNTALKDFPSDWRNFNLQPFLVDYFKTYWGYTGKKPNFIFFDNPNLTFTMMWLEHLLSRAIYIEGDIKSSGHPLSKVKWSHSDQCHTNHRFSFPMIKDDIVFAPILLGVNFEPSSIKISITDHFDKPLNFNASPYQLEDRLTGFYPYDKDLKNLVNKSEDHNNNGCTLYSDVQKGKALRIKKGSYLELAPSANYNIINRSFTISFDFKLSESEDRDVLFLASQEAANRKGLHITLRYLSPYAGFYNEDIESNIRIEKSQWYNYVFRYEKITGEQSIFIDGKKIASSYGHSSYIGTTKLMIGRGINIEDVFEGSLNNLAIWDRALASDEVLTLLNKGIDKNKVTGLKPSKGAQEYEPSYIILPLILLVFVGSLIVIRRKRRTQRTHSTQETISVEDFENDDINSINSFYFFGNFTAIDKDGNDISKVFTPKIRELFLLIFFFTQKASKGISSQMLTEYIWGGLDPSKAANNRGVAFNKLRHALNNIEGVNLNFENDHWNITFGQEVQCDYVKIKHFLNNIDKISISEFTELFKIIKRGNLLHRLNWEWLDEFKDNLMFDIADALNEYCHKLKDTGNIKALSLVANHILGIDDLNESALQFEIYALKQQHNLSKAKFLLERYCKNYEKSYGKTYDMCIDDLLEKKL